MCEILVYTIDKQGDDVYKNAKLEKRGDVITIQEDGWNWGDAELSDPSFLILKLPGVAIIDVASLISPELDTTGSKDPAVTDWAQLTNTLQFRGFNLDLDSMQAAIPAIAAPVVSQPTKGVMTPVSVAPAPVDIADAATLLSYKVQKPIVVNPAIIGTPTNVLG